MQLPPMRFTVQRMMVAVAVVALTLFRPELGTLLLILAVSTLAVRSLFAGPVGRRSRRWAVPYLVTLACLYLPFGWVAWEHPWADSRWAGIKFWPVFPGLFAGLFANAFMSEGEYSPDGRTIALIMSTGAIFRIAVFTSLGSLGRAAMVAANLIAFVGMSLESWIAYQLFEQHFGNQFVNLLSPYNILFAKDSTISLFIAFLFVPSSGVLSVGFLLLIGYLWRRMKARKPALAPGAKGSAPER